MPLSVKESDLAGTNSPDTVILTVELLRPTGPVRPMASAPHERRSCY